MVKAGLKSLGANEYGEVAVNPNGKVLAKVDAPELCEQIVLDQVDIELQDLPVVQGHRLQGDGGGVRHCPMDVANADGGVLREV